MLQAGDLRYHLSELATRIMQGTCREVLRELLASTSDSVLPEIAVYFDRNAQLSPRHAATLLVALASARPEIDLGIFEVHIRSIKRRQEFGSLSEPQKLRSGQSCRRPFGGAEAPCAAARQAEHA